MSSNYLEFPQPDPIQTPSSSDIGIGSGDRSALMVAATGLGKTVMMAALANHWPLGRVMMISHRFELNKQARRTFEDYCLESVDFEQGDMLADQCSISDRCRMVVASVQSLNSKRSGKHRFERFDPNEFGLIMIDEAHRSVSATYRRVIEYFMEGNPDCKLVGVTATPDRLDGVGLGHVFEAVGCDLNIRWGIDNGWLVPVKQFFVSVDGLDFSSIKTKKNEVGESDLDRKQLADLVERESMLHEMAHPIVELTGDSQTIVFTVSVDQAVRLAEIINRHKPKSAFSLDGSLPPMSRERQDLIQDFKNGKYQYFVNCNIATEGFDAKDVEFIAMCRPTKSRALYTQCVGRGTRFVDDTGIDESVNDADERREMIAKSRKPCCTVLDFVGMAGRHELVCTTDILAGETEPPAIVEAANRIIQSPDYDGTVIEAMEQARKEAEEREAAKRARVVARAEYQQIAIDIWSPSSMVPPRRVPGFSGSRPPSEKQKAGLQKFGFTRKEVEELNFAQASSMMGKCVERAQSGLCSIRQRRTLSKFGIDAAGMKFEEASRQIQIIANNGWKRP